MAAEKKEPAVAAGTFRNWISGSGGDFPAESGRYHLYVSLSCPFAGRALIGRHLKGLQNHISLDIVDYHMSSEGWEFNPDVDDKTTVDTVNGKKMIKEIYLLANPEYKGRNSIPILWDKKTGKLVNNESAEILRMFNSEFNTVIDDDEAKLLDLYPESLRNDIDALTEWMHNDINMGVYKAGFAQNQQDYDEAVDKLFQGLDKVEDILSKKRFLTGTTITEADVKLYTSLVRFDIVYYGHFKCNLKRVQDYPNLWGYLRDLYSRSAFKECTDFQHIKGSYYWSQTQINPTRIVPKGPLIDFSSPHNRESLQ